MSNTAAFLLGLALGATSVSISARTLMELGVLRSRVGLSLLGAAVVDDILSILAFSIFLAVYSGNGGVAGLLWIVLRMLIFLSALGIWPVGAASSRPPGGTPIHQPGYAGICHHHPAGLRPGSRAGRPDGRHHRDLPGRVDVCPHARKKHHRTRHHFALAYGFFVPIFFINIGLSVNLRDLPPGAVWLILVVTLSAILGKLLGAAGGARLGGLPGP